MFAADLSGSGCVVPKTVAGALSALPELQYMEYRAPDVGSVDV